MRFHLRAPYFTKAGVYELKTPSGETIKFTVDENGHFELPTTPAPAVLAIFAQPVAS